MNLANFKFNYKKTTLLKTFLKRKFLKLALNKNLDLFIKMNDLISTDPLITGMHEPHLHSLFCWGSEIGYSDFFFDIGANIGLSSCMLRGKFSCYYLFEPNPLAFNILNVNTKISLPSQNYKLFNIAIGTRDATETLVIPRNNWGGAYIKNADNFYTDEVLQKKEYSPKMDESSTLKELVTVKKGEDIFSTIFNDLSIQKKFKGTIKIDVEGQELAILNELKKAIPKGFDLLIIFENWSDQLSIPKLLKDFPSTPELFYVRNVNNPSSLISKIWMLIKSFINKSVFEVTLEKLNQKTVIAPTGDLVIKVNT